VTCRLHVLVGAGLIVAACTSTTHGSGRVSGSPTSSGPVTSGPPATGSVTSGPPATGSVATGPSSGGSSSLPPEFVRTPRETAIGDPATADLCTAIGLPPFDAIGPGRADYDAVQYPPGCSITLSVADKPVLTVSVFAAQHGPRDADGRTEATASGLPVYSYPFDRGTGGCERDVVADGVRLVADAIARGSAPPDEQLSCAATKAMADRVAEIAATGSVPRLSPARPTLTELGACLVVNASGITALGDFVGARVIRRGFGVNCELRTDTLFLFINVALAAAAPPDRGTPLDYGGHHLFKTASRPGFCSYVSVQGTTGDGHREEVSAAATTNGDGKPPATLCAQTAQALSLYLTAAGLS
jgi:hypothetical protein